MTPRKTILRELHVDYEARGRGEFTRPREIPGFHDHPAKYQRAVNRLLQERLIEGRTDDEGRMAIALNVNRLGQVRRELRAPWTHPGFWTVLVLLAAGGALLFM